MLPSSTCIWFPSKPSSSSAIGWRRSILSPSPLFLAVPYLMASSEEPQLMTVLFLVDPWVHQLGKHRVAIGSASLCQDCSSGRDVQKILRFHASHLVYDCPWKNLFHLHGFLDKLALAPSWFTFLSYDCVDVVGVSMHSLRRSQEQDACSGPGFHGSSSSQWASSLSQKKANDLGTKFSWVSSSFFCGKSVKISCCWEYQDVRYPLLDALDVLAVAMWCYHHLIASASRKAGVILM